MPTALLTGDINLMNVVDPDVPFRKIAPILAAADIRISNLECSLHTPEHGHTIEHEGFFADPEISAAALKKAGIDAVGIANNVNYGEANILGSMENLKRHGIPFAGAGRNRHEARKPVIIEREGVRYGFLQRSSVYWATDHEAGETGVGIAVIRGHTAYHVPMYREGSRTPPFNRPGIPPLIKTWADEEYLEMFRSDIAELREQADIVIASCHWGLGPQVLNYMKETARSAIDAGADIVMGHGPHQPLPMGFYRGKPIFYGLGSFSFHTGHLGIKHGDWIGVYAELTGECSGELDARFGFVRHNELNETVPCSAKDEKKVFENLAKQSLKQGALLEVDGDLVRMVPAQENK